MALACVSGQRGSHKRLSEAVNRPLGTSLLGKVALESLPGAADLGAWYQADELGTGSPRWSSWYVILTSVTVRPHLPERLRSSSARPRVTTLRPRLPMA